MLRSCPHCMGANSSVCYGLEFILTRKRCYLSCRANFAQGLRLNQDSVQAEIPVHVSEAWNHHDLLRGMPSNRMASQQPGVFLCCKARNFGSNQSKLDMRDVQINPDQAPYGSTHRHVIAPVQQLAQYFEEGTFDAVGCLPSV